MNIRKIIFNIDNDSHNILKNNLKGYTIHKIKHYSSWGGPEEYKKEVCEELKKIFSYNIIYHNSKPNLIFSLLPIQIP